MQHTVVKKHHRRINKHKVHYKTQEPWSDADVYFVSPQTGASLHYETTNMGLVHYRQCTCLQASFHCYSLCLPTEGWPGWVDQCDWICTKMVRLSARSRKTRLASTNFNDQDHGVNRYHVHYSVTTNTNLRSMKHAVDCCAAERLFVVHRTSLNQGLC